MFSINAPRYYLYRPPTDMRKSYDGLCGIITEEMGKDVMTGDLFIFINRSRNRIKLLRWEPGGLVLFSKRLEKGTFELPLSKNQHPAQGIEYIDLAMIITGISMKHARKRKRFLQQNTVGN